MSSILHAKSAVLHAMVANPVQEEALGTLSWGEGLLYMKIVYGLELLKNHF